MNKIIISFAIFYSILDLSSATNTINAYSILDNYMNGSKKELFKTYHFLYEKEKEYELYSEEGIRRYSNFKATLKNIKEENAKNYSYKLGLGPFADMTAQEFSEKILMKPEYQEEMFKEIEENSNSFLVEPSVNYTPKTVKINWDINMNPVKNQGTCGCCWSFATTTAVEANYNIRFGGEKIILSQQQLVDCDNYNGGCNGGFAISAYQYMKEKGVKLERDYPAYTATKGTCRFQNDGLKLVSDYQSCNEGSCTIDQWLNVLKQGPMYVSVDAGRLQNYRNGVMDPTCGRSNHAVVAYGFDSDEVGDFIVIRNSWGQGWGDKGNFRLRYNPNTNSCHATKRGYRPIVQQAPIPPPNPTPQPSSCPTFYTNCSYDGGKIDICENRDNLSPWNGMISSVKIGRVQKVTLYSKTFCMGERIDLTNDNQCLDFDQGIQNFNDKARSVTMTKEPSRGCIAFYESCCQMGKVQEICADVESLNTVGLNNMISSFRFGPGVISVQVFTDLGYKGLSYEFTQESGCIAQPPTNSFNDKIQSLRIKKY